METPYFIILAKLVVYDEEPLKISFLGREIVFKTAHTPMKNSVSLAFSSLGLLAIAKINRDTAVFTNSCFTMLFKVVVVLGLNPPLELEG